MSRIAIDTQWVKVNYEWFFLFSCTCSIFTGFLIIFFLGEILLHKYLIKCKSLKYFIRIHFNSLCDLWSTLGENEAIVQTRLGVVCCIMGWNFFWRSILIFMNFLWDLFSILVAHWWTFLSCLYVQSMNPSKVLSVKIDMT